MISIEQISFSYSDERFFSELSLAIPDGKFCCLVGPNGSGKSTLMRLAAGLLQPTSGQITWNGEALSKIGLGIRPSLVGYVPPETSVYLPFSVRHAIEIHAGQSKNSAAYLEEATHMAEELGLKGLYERSIDVLSSGERKRLFLLLSLASRPGGLLLDEPDAHLDMHVALETFARLRTLVDGGTTVLVVTHNLNLALRFADRIMLLDSSQQIVHNGNATQQFWKKLAKIYPGTFAQVRSRKRTFLVPG